MMHGGAERVQVFPFLKQVGRHEHERISGHAELLHERLVHLSEHPADGLLLSQADEPKKRADSRSGFVRASGAFTSRISSKFVAICESSSNAAQARVAAAASAAAVQAARDSRRCASDPIPALIVVSPLRRAVRGCPAARIVSM